MSHYKPNQLAIASLSQYENIGKDGSVETVFELDLEGNHSEYVIYDVDTCLFEKSELFRVNNKDGNCQFASKIRFAQDMIELWNKE